MTIARLLFIGLFALIWVSSNGQSNLSGFISLHISDSLRFYHGSMKGEISFRVKNESNNSLLVYGLNDGGFGGVPFEKSQLCELDNVGLGLGIIIYNENSDQLITSATFGHHSYDRPMTKLRLDSILYEYRKKVSQDTTVLLSFSEKVFVKNVDINSFDLELGTYFLQIVMYCGEQITFSVSKEHIVADSKRLNAALYQGCSFSNKIKIVVE